MTHTTRYTHILASQYTTRVNLLLVLERVATAVRKEDTGGLGQVLYYSVQYTVLGQVL